MSDRQPWANHETWRPEIVPNFGVPETYLRWPREYGDGVPLLQGGVPTNAYGPPIVFNGKTYVEFPVESFEAHSLAFLKYGWPNMIAYLQAHAGQPGSPIEEWVDEYTRAPYPWISMDDESTIVTGTGFFTVAHYYNSRVVGWYKKRQVPHNQFLIVCDFTRIPGWESGPHWPGLKGKMHYGDESYEELDYDYFFSHGNRWPAAMPFVYMDSTGIGEQGRSFWTPPGSPQWTQVNDIYPYGFYNSPTNVSPVVDQRWPYGDGRGRKYIPIHNIPNDAARESNMFLFVRPMCDDLDLLRKVSIHLYFEVPGPKATILGHSRGRKISRQAR